MRHNRRAVMAEQYKLYMKRNVFNGRYFVRNLQIVLCVIVALAVMGGTAFLIGTSGSKESKDKAQISAKDALLGNNEVTEAQLISNDGVVIDNNDTEEATTSIETDTEDELPASAEITAEVDKSVSVLGAGIAKSTADISNVDTTEEVEEEIKEEGEFDNRCIANVDETLNIRKEPSRDSEFVGMMQQGSIATVVDTEGEWTKIKSGDVEGYVLSEYVLTGESAEEFAKNYVTIQGKAKEDGVNVRDDRSTDANILKVLEKDEIISVVEIPEEEDAKADKDNTETTDDQKSDNGEVSEQSVKAEDKEKSKSGDITWLTVMLEDGQIGYVSQEYVDVDKLYVLAVSAEELKRREEERAAAEAAAAAAALQAARQTAAAVTASSDTTYQGAKTTPITAASSGESLGTFYITAYCGCKKCCGGHTKTASGTTPTQGRTIAADTSVLPFGTQVVIDGVVYTVEDRGSGVTGNHIDIFFATHEDAMAFGSKSVTVYKY